jgi:hypothetical protein
VQIHIVTAALTAIFDGNGSDKQLIHAVRRLTLRQGHHVPVRVHRDGDSGVTKGLHDDTR